ncbi:MAG: hypothetical protein Q8865_10625 [Bacillota bacterium]|nr:hypothetical protein [Bacillota bacterium]
MKVSVKQIEAAPLIKNSDTVTVNVSYPLVEETGDRKIEKRINNFYRNLAKDYAVYAVKQIRRRAKKLRKKDDTYLVPVTVEMTFKTHFKDSRYLEVLYIEKETPPKGYGRSVSYSDIWDIKSGELINRNKKLRLSGNTKRNIIKTVKRDVERRTKEGAPFYIKGVNHRIKRNFDASNIYITEIGAGIFFKAGSISTQTSWIPTFEWNTEEKKAGNDKPTAVYEKSSR